MLVNCRECDHRVSDAARTCPSCGIDAPSCDPKTQTRRSRHLKAWVAWPVIAAVAAFGYHYNCLPVSGQASGPFYVESVNPLTNVVVIGAPEIDPATSLRYRLGSPLIEDELRRKARQNFDLWGMLVGYSVHIDA